MGVEQNTIISTAIFSHIVNMSTRTAQRVAGSTQTKLRTPSKITVSPTVGSKSTSVTLTASRIPRSPSPRHGAPAAAAKKVTTMPAVGMAFTQPSGSAKQVSSRSGSAAQKKPTMDRSASNEHPNYMTFHMGDPCTLGALDHALTCGHKILTSRPEDCASNCQQPPNHANPRSIDQPFVCLACIIEQIKKDREHKVHAFVDTMRQVAAVIEKEDPAQWISEKVAVMEIAWREVEIEQVKTQTAEGRFCHPFYIDEEFADLASAAIDGKKTTAIDAEKKPPSEPSNQSTPRGPPSVAAKSSRTSKSPSRLPIPQKRV